LGLVKPHQALQLWQALELWQGCYGTWSQLAVYNVQLLQLREQKQGFKERGACYVATLQLQLPQVGEGRC
jgi:hypothetical protein